jgi:hypothetical protein
MQSLFAFFVALSLTIAWQTYSLANPHYPSGSTPSAVMAR